MKLKKNTHTININSFYDRVFSASSSAIIRNKGGASIYRLALSVDAGENREIENWIILPDYKTEGLRFELFCCAFTRLYTRIKKKSGLRQDVQADIDYVQNTSSFQALSDWVTKLLLRNSYSEIQNFATKFSHQNKKKIFFFSGKCVHREIWNPFRWHSCYGRQGHPRVNWKRIG